MRIQPRILHPALACLTLAWGSLLLADVSQVEEHRFTLAEGGRFSLDNVNGDIVIHGGDGDAVLVRATKKAGTQEYLDALEVIIDQGDSFIRVETRHPKGNWMRWGENRSGSVDYEITVPRGTELDGVESVNGGIEIEGVTAAVKASTVNGEIDLRGLASDARFETVNGGIDAEFTRLEGNQRVTGDTVNGAIRLVLPASASARVTAESLNGGIDAEDFGLETSRGMIGRDLEGDIGAGDARIDLDTVNGSIDLEKSDS